jgi:hypothetical protein
VRFRIYLPLAILAFVGATTGADIYARMSIAGEPFAAALQDHLHWTAVQFVGTAMLFAPFVAVALLCARVDRRTSGHAAATIFAAAMVALLYFYFQGHEGAQQALLEKKWTAASLSIGLLPFFVGIPVVLATAAAGAIAAKLGRGAINPDR